MSHASYASGSRNQPVVLGDPDALLIDPDVVLINTDVVSDLQGHRNVVLIAVAGRRLV